MKRLNVAAYCRVSTDHPQQEASLTAQIEYYHKLITSNPDWKEVLGIKSSNPEQNM